MGGTSGITPDLNAEKYDSVERLEMQMNSQLLNWESQYGCDAKD